MLCKRDAGLGNFVFCHGLFECLKHYSQALQNYQLKNLSTIDILKFELAFSSLGRARQDDFTDPDRVCKKTQIS